MIKNKLLSNYSILGILFGISGLIMILIGYLLNSHSLTIITTPPAIYTNNWYYTNTPTPTPTPSPTISYLLQWVDIFRGPLYFSITMEFLLVAVFFIIFEIGRQQGIKEAKND